MAIVVERKRERANEREREDEEKKETREREKEKKMQQILLYVRMLTFSALTPISISQKSVNVHTCTLKRK